jgi:hypothetical protein
MYVLTTLPVICRGWTLIILASRGHTLPQTPSNARIFVSFNLCQFGRNTIIAHYCSKLHFFEENFENIFSFMYISTDVKNVRVLLPAFFVGGRLSFSS